MRPCPVWVYRTTGTHTAVCAVDGVATLCVETEHPLPPALHRASLWRPVRAHVADHATLRWAGRTLAVAPGLLLDDPSDK
jgi:hypothetical protein